MWYVIVVYRCFCCLVVLSLWLNNYVLKCSTITACTVQGDDTIGYVDNLNKIICHFKFLYIDTVPAVLKIYFTMLKRFSGSEYNYSL